MSKKKAIVVGAGIVGLAMARSLALRGFSVKVIERGFTATGASIRNFGMVWPVGQPSGMLYERAVYSRLVWAEAARDAGIYHDPVGSLHLAYHPLEAAVLEEFYDRERKSRPLQWLHPRQVMELSASVRRKGLLGALYSGDELIVDPRQAIRALPKLWTETLGVSFHWGETVIDVRTGQVRTAHGQVYESDLVVVCSGVDFETIFPQLFASALITKCKLQMLRLASQPEGWRLGPALCGGLSLVHYKSFAETEAQAALYDHYRHNKQDYLDQGIHVMVSQHRSGMLTIGDSHAYGNEHEPFDAASVNQMILSYLKGFALFPNMQVAETWHGVYAKMTDGSTEFCATPEPGVYIVNGLGGAGMTLSFGLAEELSKGF
ncbi:MAG: TIGR03364 family FAD-dependent oxidoreductase [Chitinophagaceae bacterium]|nr:TIGR03364 family FAD-dependent oxidoreductase [Chitinophagaceae bacterium]